MEKEIEIKVTLKADSEKELKHAINDIKYYIATHENTEDYEIDEYENI